MGGESHLVYSSIFFKGEQKTWELRKGDMESRKVLLCMCLCVGGGEHEGMMVCFWETSSESGKPDVRGRKRDKRGTDDLSR